jgi:hypothetical protein
MPEFILKLDRQRRLIYDFDAWEKLAEKYAKNEEDFDFSKVRLNMAELPFLIYIGLAWEDKELTQEKTKELLNQAVRNGQTIADILTATTEAIFHQVGIKTEGIKDVFEKQFAAGGPKNSAGPKLQTLSKKKNTHSRASSKRPSK